MIPNNTMTEGELQQAASSIKEIETNSKLEIGKILCEVKERTEYGRFTNWLTEIGYSDTHAYHLMKMYNIYGKNPPMGGISEAQMLELVKTPEATRPILEQAITELQEEQPTIQVPTTAMRAVKGAMTGEVEVDVEDLKAQLLEPIKTSSYTSDIDHSNAFAIHINAAAHAVWKGDYTPKEYALAMKPNNHKALIELSNLQDKLGRIWEELYKELENVKSTN